MFDSEDRDPAKVLTRSDCDTDLPSRSLLFTFVDRLSSIQSDPDSSSITEGTSMLGETPLNQEQLPKDGTYRSSVNYLSLKKSIIKVRN